MAEHIKHSIYLLITPVFLFLFQLVSFAQVENNIHYNIQNPGNQGNAVYGNGGGNSVQGTLNFNSITPTAVCQGSSLSIDYTATGFGGGVSFIAELSNAAGVFPASPTFLGNLGASPSNVSIPMSTLAGAGYKIRIKASDGTISNSINVNIKRLPNPRITGNPGLSICGGSPTTLNATPATNVTYSWFVNSNPTGGNTNSLIANTAGTYTVTVDSLGCTKTSPNTIVSNQPPATATILGPANIFMCFDGANPIAKTLFANTGAGLSYQWQRNGVDLVSNGNADTLRITSVGSYTVRVTVTATGCSATSTAVTVTAAQNPPKPNAGSDKAFCSGLGTTAGFVPGAAYNGLVFTWVPTTGIAPNPNSSDITVSGINSGVAPATTNYVLFASNPATGCVSSDDVNITINPNPKDPPFTSAGEDKQVCENGTPIALGGLPANTAANTTPQITGEWSGTGLSTTTNPSTFIPNPGLIGTNTLRFTVYYDWKNGAPAPCANFDEVNITVVQAPVVQAGDPKTFCNGIDSIQLTGFTPAFPTGVWSGEGVSPKGMFYPKAFQGIPPQGVVKKCTLTAKGPGPLFCTSFGIREITVTPKQAAKAYNNVAPNFPIQSLCSNLGAYQMQGFSPAGGKWTSSTINISQGGALTFDSTRAGIHVLRYTFEKDGCKSVDSVFMTIIKAPKARVGANDSICANDPPRLLLGATPPGGRWSGLGVDTSGTIFTPTPALAGPRQLKYKVTLNGCPDSTFRIMFVKTAPVVFAGKNDTICASIDSLRMTGFSPSIGKWSRTSPSGPGMDSTGVFRPKKFNLIGNFTVRYTVKSSNGCSSFSEKQITVNPLPAAIAGLDTAMCTGNTIRIGSTSIQNVSYKWFEPLPNTLSEDTVSNPFLTIVNNKQKADTFLVKLLVTDTISKCQNRDTIQVIVYPKPIAVAIFPGVKTLCQGDSFTLKARTRLGLTYEWIRNGLSINIPSQKDSVLKIGLSGKYQLVVRNLGAVCSDTSLSDTLQIFPRFIPEIIGTRFFCTDSVTQLKVNPVFSGFTYEWQYNGKNVPDSIASTFSIGKIGTVRVILRTDKGCRDSSLIANIDSLPFPKITSLNRREFVCEGGTVTFRVNFDSLYQYRWTDSSKGITLSNSDSLIIGKAGKYYVEVFNGCPPDKKDSVVLERVIPLPRFGILNNGRQDTIVCTEVPTRLFGPLGYTTYLWTSDSVGNGTGRQFILNTGSEREYSLKLKVTDQFGCANSDSIHVVVQECNPNVFVPSAFSPNGDKVNDVWRCQGYNLTDFKLYVYNRWGQMIFFSDDIEKGWDGYFNGTVCPSGAYKWVIEYTGFVGDEEISGKRNGSVTIIR